MYACHIIYAKCGIVSEIDFIRQMVNKHTDDTHAWLTVGAVVDALVVLMLHIHSVVALIGQQLAMQISYVNKSKCWMSLVEEATGNWSLVTKNWAQ